MLQPQYKVAFAISNKGKFITEKSLNVLVKGLWLSLITLNTNKTIRTKYGDILINLISKVYLSLNSDNKAKKVCEKNKLKFFCIFGFMPCVDNSMTRRNALAVYREFSCYLLACVKTY